MKASTGIDHRVDHSGRARPRRRVAGREMAMAMTALALAVALAIPAQAFAQDAPAEEDLRPGVAVLPLENGGSYGPDREDLEAMQVGLQQILLSELDVNTELRIVERSRIRDILAEQDLATEGRVDARTAAEVGRLVGARYVITGSFMDLWGDFRLDTRIWDQETSEILRTESVRGSREDLYSLLVEMASKIMVGVDLPALPAEQREAREAREIPSQAITLYSRAQALEDFGQTSQARELYQRIVSEFPQMTEAGEALEQLQGP
jgi:TolB-like protein